MTIHDITVAISSELPYYPGDVAVSLSPWNSIANGDEANLTRLTLCSHSGTHVDAPRHFNDQGITVDLLPPEIFLGPAVVVEISGVAAIGAQELRQFPLQGAQRVLLKTGNSDLWKSGSFSTDYAALSVDGARYLVELGIKLVGIDYLSVEPFHGNGDVHRALLDNGVIILEGLNLSEVPQGEYELICLPLKIKGCDGAPARALLRTLSK
ncbi:cyclase family protein [Geomesophilobacter sediminis]|uniref:Kynurenine formamidase n=1 Tax=Geomesophilobacter sediminis TaxID=2798584 RepID=A0A8J7JDP8_9BACT|nr:cyclase family protein [Geomesophilobacter sediminis]MBJ6725436.1 cyclase family protein [Geomesophilobacter sediminis]